MSAASIVVVSILSLPVILVVLIRSCLLAVTVENTSMSPTLTPGEKVLVVRWWPKRWLRRGAIVLVTPGGKTTPHSLVRELPYIKRVVGMPGETIETSINELDEINRVREAAFHNRDGRRSWCIPPGHIFVRGDHPVGGFDSLSWGPIPVRNVQGIAVAKLPSAAPRHSATVAAPLPAADIPMGETAPSFIAETLRGETVASTVYAGRDLLLLFISPDGCCAAAALGAQSRQAEAARAGVALVLVSDGDAEQTRAFVDELRVRLPVLVAPRASNPFFSDYRVGGTPSYCLLDAQGRVRPMPGLAPEGART